MERVAILMFDLSPAAGQFDQVAILEKTEVCWREGVVTRIS